MNPLNKSLILALALRTSECLGQGTLQITFEGTAPFPPETGIYVQQYFEAGMWFRPLGQIGPGNGFDRRRGGTGIPFIPDNGSAYIAAALGDSFVFSFLNGRLFGMTSVDLAGYSTIVPDAFIHFVGYRNDGSTITVDVERHGIVFETFYFDKEWSDLTRVEIPNYGWSLDNLVVSIPEPSSVALLAVGALTFLFNRRKRRES